ncbi:hypothetical protein [Streptomyces canus]
MASSLFRPERLRLVVALEAGSFALGQAISQAPLQQASRPVS